MRHPVACASFIFLMSLIVSGGCTLSPEARLEKAEGLLQVGGYSEAKEIIEELIKADSVGPEAIYGQGLLEEYRGFDWDALIKYLEAAKLRGGFLPAMKAFTDIAIEGGYLGNARRMIEILIQYQPENPRWYLLQAKIDMLEHKLPEARLGLGRADSLGVDETDLALARVEMALRSDDPDSIVPALGKLGRFDLTSAAHCEEAASLYSYMNMIDSSIAYQRRAVEKDPDNIEYRLRLARYLFDQLYLREAYSIVDELITEAEEYGQAYILSAYILRAMERSVAADQQFFRYLQLKQNSAVAQRKYGEFFAFFDDSHMAQIQYEVAFRIASNLKYADEYVRETFLKMENTLLDGRYLSMAVDHFAEGEQLLGDTLDMYFIDAELKSYFDETVDSARIMVDNRLRKNWDNREWLELAARYYFRRNVFDSAIVVYRRLLEFDFPKEVYFTNLLDIYAKSRNWRAAETLQDIMPVRFRDSRRIQERMYDLYLAAEQWEKATERAEELNRRCPAYMPYIQNLADLYVRRGTKEDAYRLFAGYIAKYENDPEGHYRLAQYELADGRLDSIPARLDRALQCDTGYAFAYELRGIYHQQTGNINAALQDYRKAISLNWPTPEAYFYLADYYYQKRDSLGYAGSLAMAAARYFEDDRRGYLLLGNIYFVQERYKLARLQYFKGARLFPEDPEFYFLLGKVHIKLEDVSEAKKFLRQSLDNGLSGPQQAEARRLLASL